MLTISLDSSQLERGLGQLLHNLTRRKAVNAAIAAELLSLTEANFENESWGGQHWKPTRRGGKILQLSGQLAGSISTSATNSFARIGSNKKYAAIHHLGGKAGRGRKVTIPARPYLPINGSGQLQAGGEQRILDVVKDALVQGI